MRLGVFSNKNLDPWVNWTTLGPPLLEALASHPDACLIAPPPIERRHWRVWTDVASQTAWADTVFWMQGCARPELPIHLAASFRGPVRRSAFVVDAWRQDVGKIGALAVLQRLNPCFVAFHEGLMELRRRYPQGRFEWLPFGVDTKVFDSVSGPRPIFAYWMGRRAGALHQALVEYCSQRGLAYRYTLRSGEFPNARDLGQVVGSTQYFIVAPPDLADPERTGGFSPFVMRYLEGLAAGARLLGVLPASGEYEALLPTEAILTVAADGSDLAEKLDADRQNPEVWQAVARARDLVRATHSWERRAKQIYQRLGEGRAIGFEEPPRSGERAAGRRHLCEAT